MAIPTYTPGYPPDGSSLGQTKSTIRNNLDGTFETLAVDHVNNNGVPGSNPAGYHTIIHQVPQTNVDDCAGYNQIFSGVPGGLSITTVNDGHYTHDTSRGRHAALFFNGSRSFISAYGIKCKIPMDMHG
jgi:hypothetical protein